MSLEDDVIAAIRDTSDARRLQFHHRRDLATYGAEPMVLLRLAEHHRSIAHLDSREWGPEYADVTWAFRDGPANPAGDRARGDLLERLALQVLDAGGWTAVATGPLRELVSDIPPRGPGWQIDIDRDKRAMHLNIRTSALLEDWVEGRHEGPEHAGWPTITARVYGDPRWEDGRTLVFWGHPLPGELEALTFSMTYDLGKRRST